MANEKTRLLDSCVINFPKDKGDYIILYDYDKTKGLSLEELMPFKDDPWWQNVRFTFFISFWLTLLIVFSAACILSIIQHGSCTNMNSSYSIELLKAVTIRTPLNNLNIMMTEFEPNIVNNLTNPVTAS